MQRILVIGPPGAGKSCFSRALSELTGLPLYHIDNLYWNERGESISREELLLLLDPILKSERWIIDGNYSATFAHRVGYATTVILLDIDPDACEEGIRERTGKPRSDIPFIESEIPLDLITVTRRFRPYTLPKMLKELENHPRVKLIRFNTREDANNYLHSLE